MIVVGKIHRFQALVFIFLQEPITVQEKHFKPWKRHGGKGLNTLFFINHFLTLNAANQPPQTVKDLTWGVLASVLFVSSQSHPCMVKRLFRNLNEFSEVFFSSGLACISVLLYSFMICLLGLEDSYTIKCGRPSPFKKKNHNTNDSATLGNDPMNML